jgi:uncharacterized membrane protein required for colicin V production
MENAPAFSVVDIAACLVVAFTTIHGFIRRLSGELAALVASAAALALGLVLCRPAGDWLAARTRLETDGARTLAYIAVVLVSAAAMLLLRLALKRVMQVAFEPATDRIGGGVAGFVRGTVTVLIVFLAMNLWPHDYLNRVFGTESLIGRTVRRYAPPVRERQEAGERLKRGAREVQRRVMDLVPDARR